MECCAGIAWFRVLINIASHMAFHACTAPSMPVLAIWDIRQKGTLRAIYWCTGYLVYPFQKKTTQADYNSTFSLQSTNQISGFKISSMPLYFLILERIY
jgi:hypothetical protein